MNGKWLWISCVMGKNMAARKRVKKCAATAAAVWDEISRSAKRQTAKTDMYRQGSMSVGCLRRKNNWGDKFSNFLASSFFCFFFDTSHATLEVRNYLLKWFHFMSILVATFPSSSDVTFWTNEGFFSERFLHSCQLSLLLRSLDGLLKKKALSDRSATITLALTKY